MKDLATTLTDLLFDEPGVGRCLVGPDGTIRRANTEWLRSVGSIMSEPAVDLATIAEAVRAACLAAAEEAYERAGMQGLCAEGRWDLALDAIKGLDVGALMATHVPRPPDPAE